METMQLSVLDAWDVLAHIGYSDKEICQVLEMGFSNVTWGDAVYTLVGNIFALDCIQRGNMYLDTPKNAELVEMRYWEVVDEDVYLNLESN